MGPQPAGLVVLGGQDSERLLHGNGHPGTRPSLIGQRGRRRHEEVDAEGREAKQDRSAEEHGKIEARGPMESGARQRVRSREAGSRLSP